MRRGLANLPVQVYLPETMSSLFMHCERGQMKPCSPCSCQSENPYPLKHLFNAIQTRDYQGRAWPASAPCDVGTLHAPSTGLSLALLPAPAYAALWQNAHGTYEASKFSACMSDHPLAKQAVKQSRASLAISHTAQDCAP